MAGILYLNFGRGLRSRQAEGPEEPEDPRGTAVIIWLRRRDARALEPKRMANPGLWSLRPASRILVAAHFLRYFQDCGSAEFCNQIRCRRFGQGLNQYAILY
ncbi:MAG: hypothetical protein WB392_12500 [Methanotrichaceae archaeon]